MRGAGVGLPADGGERIHEFAAVRQSGARGKLATASMKAEAGMVMKVENGVDEIDFAPGTMRPSGAFMALLEALIREIALAMNLPYGFVYNMAAFGGVTARLETQAAQRVFRWYQEMLEHILLNRVKRKVLLLGIAAGRIKACGNWDSGSWRRYGATLTGDVGHQVQADLDLVRCGAKTRSQLAGEYNNDFRQVMEKKSLCKSTGYKSPWLGMRNAKHNLFVACRLNSGFFTRKLKDGSFKK